MRKILGVTGIRSEYDIMTPVYRAIEAHSKLQLQLVVTGTHLSPHHNFTLNQIEKDGFPIADRIESLFNSDQKSSRAKGLAVQLAGLVQSVSRIEPDFLLVLGDREESITTALTGAYLDIPVAHLCGGDKVIGNVDDVVRHAVTKLSHLHFTTNEASRERVLKLGEEPFRVHNVGNPGLDRFRAVPRMTPEALFLELGFSRNDLEQPLLMVVQHPLSSETEKTYGQMKETLEAIKELNFPTVVTYPNSDPGNHGIIRCIQEYRSLHNLRIFRNVPTTTFVNVLRHAACLIGNSSLGFLEGAFLRLPVLNVGNRQQGRLHGDNLIFVPHDRLEIARLVREKALSQAFLHALETSASPYGDGHSSQRIVDVLDAIAIDEKLLVKKITYD